MANYFLAAKNTTAEERQAVCSFLESILFETGNYEGFRYLSTDEISGNGSRRFYFDNEVTRPAFEEDVKRINKILV